MLSFDGEGEQDQVPPHGGHDGYTVVTNFVLRDDEAHAIVKSFLLWQNGPEDVHQVTLGTWPSDDAEEWPPGCDDHVTFACLGWVDADPETIQLSLVDAHPGEPSPMWGQALTADQSRTHPRLPELWEVIEFVNHHDAAVVHHLDHA